MHSHHFFQHLGDFIGALMALGIGAFILIKPEKVFKGEVTPEKIRTRRRAGVLIIVVGFLFLLVDIIQLKTR